MKNVHYMTRLELEEELIERRLQVQNLIHEIQRKDEYIRIYSDGLNKIMEDDDMLVVLEFDVIQWNLLLLYIEQLEKENEKANKYIDFYKDLTEKQNKSLEEFKQENKQLENNRDKAIERCEFWLDFYRNVNNDNIIILRLNDILSKLKGDSDEN